MAVFLSAGSGGCRRIPNKIKPKSSDRYKGPRRLFPWVRTPEGRTALCLILILLMDNNTEDNLRDDPLVENVSSHVIFAELMRMFPLLNEVVIQKTGHELTFAMVTGRIANMRRDNRNCTFSLGSEFPKHHPVLRHILPHVLTWINAKGRPNGVLDAFLHR